MQCNVQSWVDSSIGDVSGDFSVCISLILTS